ncbi:MAG: GDP-mannose 4,6-dehydratase [Candidatus Omnitrophica bacterium]|nr:GDP-mannose 4,6-dehydratase [Candidatus Omnitrophota bacterium]
MAGNFWNGKKVLITGANGFVGSWLAKNLADEGAEITVLQRDVIPNSNFSLLGLHEKASIVSGSLVDFDTVSRALNEYEVEFVFHLAAQAIVSIANASPLSTFDSNIKGTWTLLEACRNSKWLKGIVVASSDKAYGNQPKLPYTEGDSLNGLYPYDASKACADILSRCYAKTYGLNVGVTRCANIYGGGDLNFSRIVPDTIRSVLNNINPVIKSDGTPVRDFIFVQDAANAYLTVAESVQRDGVKGEAFNFGSGTPVTVLELVKKIISVSGKSVVPDIQGKSKPKGEIDEQYLASDKAKKVLGWQPKYTLEDGLKQTIKWYSDFLVKR